MTDILETISDYSYFGIFFLLLGIGTAPLLMPPSWMVLASILDIIGNFLNRRKFGYVLTSFLFAATPLPDNMLFVAYGLMRIKSIGIYIGFWFGRVLSYYIMLSISYVVLVPFLQLFEDRYTGIIIADGIGIGSLVLFASIDWGMLITQKKFKFVKPKIWRF